jgi:undecaprenyl-diphosphatase
MEDYEKKVFIFLILIFLFLLIFDFLIGDEKIFLFINKKIANPILDFVVLKIFTPLFFLLPIIPFLMIFKKERNLGIFSLFSGPLCYILGNVVKYILRFPRPFNTLPARTLGPWHPSPFSFPSTTTMLAFGFAIPIFLKKKKLGIFLLSLAFLVGFSVIYTGFHFLKDVAAGIFFSALIVFFENKIYKKFSL